MDHFRKKTRIPSTTILNVRVSAISKREALAWIERWIGEEGRKMVVTPNPEQVMIAQKDGSFRQILNGADLALADGGGLVWASKQLHLRQKTLDLRGLNSPSGLCVEGSTLPERVTGEEIMRELICLAAEKGWKVFLLGGKPGVADRAEKILKFKVKNLKLKVKTSSGARDIRHETREERAAVIDKINRFRPDILFVAYGAPWQERWLAKNLKHLDVRVGMVVGGALDMIVDPSLRPPDWMTRIGVDWLYRLLRQPWRIRRQLALIEFVFQVLRKSRESSF